MRKDEEKAWYGSLPKKKRELLDKWEELGLTWISGPYWSEKPHSVELEGRTDAGEDMIVNLEDVSNEALKEYIDDFDIDYNVSLWWPDGRPGRGVPFDSQAEQVEDYEQWLARLKDIIAESSGNVSKRRITNEEQLYIDRFVDAYKELRSIGIGVRYSRKNDEFRFYHKKD